MTNFISNIVFLAISSDIWVISFSTIGRIFNKVSKNKLLNIVKECAIIYTEGGDEMKRTLADTILKKRKALGLTQQALASRLDVSSQAVSKWEKGTSCPDIELLPELAFVLGTTVDALLGYRADDLTVYEERYRGEDYYWGLQPNDMCYDIMRLRPPVKPYRVLEIGCGEGKDAVFLAKNGYEVTAFDAAQSGIDKACELARRNGVHIDFFKADMRDWRPEREYDIIYSSGVFCYADEAVRRELIDSLKDHTAQNGINAVNVFVEKPFILTPPDRINSESYKKGWLSGELFMYYHDWLFHKNSEIIFDCTSSGSPHQHCMDILIAEKKG